MNSFLAKYTGISFGYGLIHSIYHVYNYKHVDNKISIITDKTLWILGYTSTSLLNFPLFLYEDIRNTEIYLRKLNKDDHKSFWKTIE